MSEIKSFSDYTSKYNSNVDFSALFSGTSDSSSVGNTNMLSDYAAIKNGSYGKLMKAIMQNRMLKIIREKVILHKNLP